MFFDAKTVETRLVTRETVCSGWQSTLSKCVAKFVTLKESSFDPIAEESFLREVLLYKVGLLHSCKTSNVLKAQELEYDELEKQLRAKLDKGKASIADLETNLSHEQEVRKHRLAINEVAKTVTQHKSRAHYKRKVDALEEGIQRTVSSLHSLNQEIHFRKRQLTALLSSIDDILMPVDLEEDEQAAIGGPNDGIEMEEEEDDERNDMEGGRAAKVESVGLTLHNEDKIIEPDADEGEEEGRQDATDAGSGEPSAKDDGGQDIAGVNAV